MPRYSTLEPHLTVAALEQHYRAAHHPVERTHWHLLWLIAAGHRLPAAARLVAYNANWAREIVRRYNAEGPTGITDRRLTNPGHPPLLDGTQQEALRTVLADPPPDGGLWTGPKVAAWMREQLGRSVGPQRGWEAIRALGLTPQRPRPHAVHADPVAQEAFKKGGSRPSSPPSGRRTRTQ